MRGYSEGDGLEDAAFGAGAGLFGNLGGQYAVAPLVRAAGNTSVGRSVADLLANAGTGAGNAVRGVRGQAPIPYEGSSVPRLSVRSEEHTSELQSLVRISYAVFCLKQKKN